MGNNVGQIVRHDDFWGRSYELEEIWEVINSGGHPLLCAPRRVGKSSIMYKILDQPQAGYIPIYINTEAANSQQEFWSKIFHALKDQEFINNAKFKVKNFVEQLKNINITKISATGVEFGDGKTLDFKSAFEYLIKDLDSDIKLIIMFDEFAQTIENIIKYHKARYAIELLADHRSLRQNDKFTSKVTFIYAGSIGLESIVSNINASKHINDLTTITINPYTSDEAVSFITKLFKNTKITAKNEDINYCLALIEWHIPFYIQLLVSEIKRLYRRNPELNKQVIDNALENALKNRNHFASWHEKLKASLTNNHYLFCKAVLNVISQEKTINSLLIQDITSQYQLTDDERRKCMQSLVYDGYINNDNDVKQYRFNSPILSLWWNKNVAN